ncbi:hypothetical protein GCM10009738_85810 [Kitasatospora viridis]
MPVLPRAAAPELHREGAAKQEKPVVDPPEPARAAPVNARPPKRRRRDNDDPKTKKVGFRCTEEQKTRVEQLAAAAELTVADYLERRALAPGGAGAATRDEQVDKAVQALDATRFQLAKVGVNLNQIAFQLNAHLGVDHGSAQATLAAAAHLVAETRRAVAEVDASAMRLAKAGRG